MTEKSKTCRNPDEEADEEMEAIGYPPPIDPAAFARRLSEIIKRALQKGFRQSRH
jgi:hypothetical protein